MEQNTFRAGFELNEADMQLQWQFTAFLRKVIRNARCDYLRKEQRSRHRMVQEESLDKSLTETLADPNAQDRLEQVLDRTVLHQEIVRLTPKERQALLFVCVKGYTLKQAAQRMGVSPGRVAQLRDAALKKLQKALQEEEP